MTINWEEFEKVELRVGRVLSARPFPEARKPAYILEIDFGEEIDDPALRRCALVATQYGERDAPLGMLGVIGPSRMDYRRVIPLVEYLSEVLTEKLSA